MATTNKGAEGKNYCLLTLLYKQCFAALLSFRIMEILKNLSFDDGFISVIGEQFIDYLKDVLALLAMMISVRECSCNTEMQLEDIYIYIYIPRTDEENTIYLVLRVSCY